MKIVLASLLVFISLFSINSTYASADKIGVMSNNPSSSPTGNAVVFEADFENSTSLMHLWLANMDGSNLHKITTSSIADEEPAWSPNGKQIAFASTTSSVTDIWTVWADGTHLKQLTVNALNNRQPAWSPDSSKIVFVSDRGGSNDVWIMNADGTSQMRLTKMPGQENHPSFSPAGNEIVFSETINATHTDYATLMTVGIDGSALTPLTSGKFHDWNPSWGINGVIFASDRDTSSAHWKIWTINPNSPNLNKLGDVMGLDPSWLPDGRVLYTDEINGIHNVLSVASIYDPVSGIKSPIISVKGYNVQIDIQPGKSPNRINPNSDDNVPVAILSSKSLNVVTQLDRTSLTFGRTGDEQSLSRCETKTKDVNGDGLPDLICSFKIRNATFRSTDTVGVLRFLDNNQIPYEGRGAVVIKNKENDDQNDDS